MSMVLRSDADASAYSKKMLSAQQAGLILFGIFDTSEEKAKRNLSLSGADEAWKIVGTPIIGLTGTEFKSQHNFIQTEVDEPSGDFTFMCVGRAVNSKEDVAAGAPSSMIFGNYRSHSGEFLGIAMGWQGTPGTLSFSRAHKLSNGTHAMRSVGIIASEDVTAWHLIAIRYKLSTRTISINDITHQRYAEAVEADVGAVPALNLNGKLRIGSSYTSQSGPCEVSQIRFWDRYLSDDGIAEVVAEMRYYELEHNGRTV